jgi:SAM-dependent methyltransferase
MADAEARADFAAVDAGDAGDLVSMMDATDAWPAVQALRAWVLDHADAGDKVVLDVGSGPGTFGGLASATGAWAIDLDRSFTMLREAQHRRADARPVLGDAAHLPLCDGAAHLVRAERVLQWATDPRAALAELRRVTTGGGWTAVTDTDWGSFTVQHPDERAPDRWAAAALGWVPHPRVAQELAHALIELGASDVSSRADTLVISAWDPDDPTQHDGPPGLPLRSIAAGGAVADQPALAEDLDVLADRARHGRFRASLDLVTVLAPR